MSALIEHGKIPQRVSIHCTNGCGTLTRVYRVEPRTQIGAFKFCPLCGADIMPYLSADENGWEALAVAYNMSVEAIRVVYAAWNPHEHYRFSDYIAAMRGEYVAPQLPHESLAERIPPTPMRTLPRMKVPSRG